MLLTKTLCSTQVEEVSEVPQLWSAQEAFMRQVGFVLLIDWVYFFCEGWVQALHVHSFCNFGISHRSFAVGCWAGLPQNIRAA